MKNRLFFASLQAGANLLVTGQKNLLQNSELTSVTVCKGKDAFFPNIAVLSNYYLTSFIQDIDFIVIFVTRHFREI
jgi:hypothetical protein